MTLRKIITSRRKFKYFILFIVLLLIILTVLFLFIDDTKYYKSIDILNNSNNILIIPKAKSHNNNNQVENIIMPEKYNEHIIKSRLIENKIKFLTQNKNSNNNNKNSYNHIGDNDGNDDDGASDIVKSRFSNNQQFNNNNENSLMKTNQQLKQTITRHIHIFYNIPVLWYKQKQYGSNSMTSERILDSNKTVTVINLSKLVNIAFYPLLGFYNSTLDIIKRHLDNIKNCGIGVLVLSSSSLSSTTRHTSIFTNNSKKNKNKLTEDLLELLIDMAPSYNLTITFEIDINHNQSIENDIIEQLKWLRKYYHYGGIYKVYSMSKYEYVPLIYVKNAYKIDKNQKIFCPKYFDEDGDIEGDKGGESRNRKYFMNAYFIGHIKLKQHADVLRRLCFDGFYTKIPSNGATFASTWKNWSYLKTFAQTYKMLFVPTVGPGYTEHKKLPRHDNIQRLRANGRYYGVAWRTAISNHIGFISIDSYNNWPEGTQIEEAITNNGYMDYAPGKPYKYLDLTTFWVNNFLKTKKSAKNCFEFLNNTIC